MALKFIRDNLKSFFWILWLVILAMVGLIFFNWGGYNQSTGERTDVAATVGGETISYGELQDEYRNLESQYKEAFGEQFNADLARQLNLPMQALNRLVNQRIMLREARLIGLRVTDEEVQKQILEYPVFQRDGRFVGQDEYRQTLRRIRTTPAEFESQQRQVLLLRKLESAITASVYVSDAEVEEAYRDEVERAKIRYLELPATEIADVEVATSELRTYLEEHVEDFQVPERRVVDYLLVDTGKLRQEVEISEDAMRAYYDAHQKDYTRPEQGDTPGGLQPFEEVQPAIRARLLTDEANRLAESKAFEIAGRVTPEMSVEDFRALGTAEGLEVVTTEPLGRDDVIPGLGRNPAFNQAAFELTVGGVSPPLAVARGRAIAKLREIHEARLPELAEVEDEVRRAVAAEKRKEAARARLAAAVAAGQSLDEVAGELGLEVQEPAEFGRGGTIPGLGSSRAVVDAALALGAGEVGGPVASDRGAVLFEVVERKTFDPAAFAEAKESTRESLKQRRVQELQQTILAERLQELNPQYGARVIESFGKPEQPSTPG